MKVLLVLIGIAVLFLLVPVGIVLEYCEAGFFCYLKVLFFKIRLNKRKTTKNTSEQKKVNRKKPGDYAMFSKIADPVIKTLGRFVKYVCVDKLVAELTVAGKDAFATAMLYGTAAASIGMIFPFLNNNIKIKKKFLSVNADFNSDKVVLYFLADVSIKIWQILVIAVYFLFKYVSKINSKKEIEDNG